METFSALLDLCAANSLVTGEFPSQRPVTHNFGVFFDLRLNKRLSNNGEAGDLRDHHTYYEVTVMILKKNMFYKMTSCLLHARVMLQNPS